MNGNVYLLDKYKKTKTVFMSKSVFLGVAVAVFVAVAAFVFYGAEQQSVIIEGSELAPAAKQGSFASPSGFGADLNKEQWHEDPFADEAAAVRAAYTGDK